MFGVGEAISAWRFDIVNGTTTGDERYIFCQNGPAGLT